MGLYIKGLKMPQSGQYVFVLTSSGIVENVNGLVVGEAVEVKSLHGDLIDRGALLGEWPSTDCGSIEWVETIRASIKLAPTVIEAEEKDDG